MPPVHHVDAALTKQFMVEFVNTYNSEDFECSSESSNVAFTHAKILVSSSSAAATAATSDVSSFFVTVSSSFPHVSSCIQYGGGEYEHNDCERTTQAITSLSAQEEGEYGLVVVVTLPLGPAPAPAGLSSWTVCVGNGYGHGDRDNLPLHVAGSVLLSTTPHSHSHSHTTHHTHSADNYQNKRGVGQHRYTQTPEPDGNQADKPQASFPEMPVLPAMASQSQSRSPAVVDYYPDDGVHDVHDGGVGHVRADTVPSACPSVAGYADGYCDSDNNIADCDYDGGDCCFEDCTHLDCFEQLLDYPKACHKDETITVNYMWDDDDAALSSYEPCTPTFDVASGGAWCSLRAAVAFCQSHVVGRGEQRCIVQIPADSTVELDAALGEIALDDNGRSLVIRGNSSSSSVVRNTPEGGDSRFLSLQFAANHSSSTEFVLEHVAVTGFNASWGAGGAVHCAYLKKGAFTDVYFHNNHAEKSGGGLYSLGVENVEYTDLVFEGNSAFEEGGGISVLSEAGMSATYTNMRFTSNTAGTAGGQITSATTHTIRCALIII